MSVERSESVESERPAERPCRGCSSPLPEGALRCENCGALQRDDVRCPHCGAAASTSTDGELRARCDVCGGPRLPFAPGVRTSERALAALRRAEAARRARAGWRTALVLGGLALPTSVLFFGLLLLAFSASLALLAAIFVVLTPLALVSALSLSRTRQKTKEISVALDEAWLHLATDVATQTEEPLTPEVLARLMQLSESQAEEMLALLEASDVVRSELTDDGQLLYRPKLRIGASKGPVAEARKTESGPAKGEGEGEGEAKSDAEALAELEAAAEAEALAELEATRAKGGGA